MQIFNSRKCKLFLLFSSKKCHSWDETKQKSWCSTTLWCCIVLVMIFWECVNVCSNRFSLKCLVFVPNKTEENGWSYVVLLTYGSGWRYFVKHLLIKYIKPLYRDPSSSCSGPGAEPSCRREHSDDFTLPSRKMSEKQFSVLFQGLMCVTGNICVILRFI